MFDIGKILKRAWHILWNYRVLWIFGLLLAITMGTTGGRGGTGLQYQLNDQDLQRFTLHPTWGPEFNSWFNHNVAPLLNYPGQHVGAWIALGVGFLLFILILSAGFALIRYPSEAAAIRLVDGYEQTGEKSTFRQGWKLGWTRRAFRMWVIDLILGVPIFLLVLLMIGVGFAVYFSVASHSLFTNVAGTVASIGGFFLFIFIMIVGSVFLNLIRQFFIRKAALDNTTIGESLKLGWKMFVNNWKNGAVTWLVVAALTIGMGIVGVIVFFLLIPAYAVMAIPAVIIAAIPGLIAFGLTMISGSLPFAAIIGGLFFLPFFFIVLLLPLSFVSGLFKIFESSIWTLAYREMKAGEVVSAESAPTESA